VRNNKKADVRFGSKADVTLLDFDVRFTPESRHSPAPSRCQLWAKSGLMHRNKELSLFEARPTLVMEGLS
jgi:hypothetical protein